MTAIRLGLSICALVAAVGVPPVSAVEPPVDSPLSSMAPADHRIDTDTYLVTLAPGVAWPDIVQASDVRADLGGAAFNGVAVEVTAAQASLLRQRSGVVAVEPNRPVTLAEASPARGSGPDRIDQRGLPPDDRYLAPNSGEGVHVFVIDGGINPGPEFVNPIGEGTWLPSVGTDTSDCDGHGTNVARMIASSTYGVAPGVILHPVRVFNCAGSATTADMVSGMNWVADHASGRAVVNFSARGPYSVALNSAAKNLFNKGFLVVGAAGNSGTEACGYSPGSEPSVITVGGMSTFPDDYEVEASNYGPCVDIYAPWKHAVAYGVQLEGTSASAPHVTGAAAIYWAAFPTATVAEVRSGVLAAATPNMIRFPRGQRGSPNLLLYVLFTPVTPGPPREVVTQRGNASAVVAWQAPINDGNAPITSYVATASPSGITCTAVGSTQCTLSGLVNGDSYEVFVVAVNSAGVGERSLPISSFRPATVPGVPRTVKATQRGRAVRVRWQPPASDGGESLRGYTLTIKPGTKTCATRRTTCLLKGLKKGKKYRVSVLARNSLGAGPAKVIVVRVK